MNAQAVMTIFKYVQEKSESECEDESDALMGNMNNDGQQKRLPRQASMDQALITLTKVFLKEEGQKILAQETFKVDAEQTFDEKDEDKADVVEEVQPARSERLPRQASIDKAWHSINSYLLREEGQDVGLRRRNIPDNNESKDIEEENEEEDDGDLKEMDEQNMDKLFKYKKEAAERVPRQSSIDKAWAKITSYLLKQEGKIRGDMTWNGQPAEKSTSSTDRLINSSSTLASVGSSSVLPRQANKRAENVAATLHALPIKQSYVNRNRKDTPYKTTTAPIYARVPQKEIGYRKESFSDEHERMIIRQDVDLMNVDDDLLDTQLSKNLKHSFRTLPNLSSKKNIQDQESKTSSTSTLSIKDVSSQILAAVSVSIGSMVVGFLSGYTSPAIVSMRNPEHSSFPITNQEESWIGGLMPLAALVGGLFGGTLIEYFGRKKTILSTAPLFFLAWLLIGFATDVMMIFVGRSIAGFCVGIASLALPVYLGETLQAEVRGKLGLTPTAFGNIGILLVFVAGKYLNWRQLAFLGAAIPVPFMILMVVVPETPRWCIENNRPDEAKKSLRWLRHKDADIDEELNEVINSQNYSEEASWCDLFLKRNRTPLLICIFLMFFQQLSGINAVIFYTVQIFKDAGSTIDENLCTIIVGVVNFLSTILATFFIDRLGRKILLYISSVLMTISLATLGTFFYMQTLNYDLLEYGWIPLTSFVVFVIAFSFGLGPIPWLMMGEILPAQVRGKAASIATTLNWACTFLVTKTFHDIQYGLGAHGAFWLFGSICFIGLFFIIKFVPETKGKSLAEIELIFDNRPTRIHNEV